MSDQTRKLCLPTPCVTFDQPLYIKAVDVVAASDLDVVCRLGTFHTIMSFLGSIAYLMHASALEEVLSVMYGSNTVQHVLSGKAHARALRVHFLVHGALT